MASPQFYIGRVVDEKTGKITADAVQYDPADLTTHAFITGMTGSGKTGLCITLLEEAALQGIPAIVIDPKGDISNLVPGYRSDGATREITGDAFRRQSQMRGPHPSNFIIEEDEHSTQKSSHAAEDKQRFGISKKQP